MNISDIFRLNPTESVKDAEAADKKKKAAETKSVFKVKDTDVLNSLGKSDEVQGSIAKEWEQNNIYKEGVLMSCQVLNKTLTNYRDMYPNIIGFTAKVQSELNALRDSVLNGLNGLMTELGSCRTQAEFDAKMSEIKGKIDEMMQQFKAKFDVISAITSALPTFSEIRNKFLDSDLNVHDTFDKIIKGMASDPTGKAKLSKSVFGDFDQQSVNTKITELKQKDLEYKKELKEAKDSKDEHKISRYQGLVDGNAKLLDVFETMAKAMSGLKVK